MLALSILILLLLLQLTELRIFMISLGEINKYLSGLSAIDGKLKGEFKEPLFLYDIDLCTFVTNCICLTYTCPLNSYPGQA